MCANAEVCRQLSDLLKWGADRLKWFLWQTTLNEGTESNDGKKVPEKEPPIQSWWDPDRVALYSLNGYQNQVS